MTVSTDASPDVIAAVRGALDKVIDPCALVNGTKLSLTDLGMIHSVSVDDEGVHIDLLLDDPLCLYMGAIHQEIRDQIDFVLPGRPVDISIRGDIIWTSEHATPQTRRKIAEWQQQRASRIAKRLVPLAMPTMRSTGKDTNVDG